MKKKSRYADDFILVLMLGPALLWFVFFFLVPLAIIVFYSFCERGTYGGIVYRFTLRNYVEAFDALYLNAFVRSVRIAFLNTFLCLIIGYPVAYYISTKPPRIKNSLILLVIVPFWTNFLVRTYSWMIILRTEGLVNSLLLGLNILRNPLNLLFSEKAVVIGLVYGYLPFMILPIYASIEKVDFLLLDAAKDLGANSMQVFAKIMLPLTLPGIIAGSILVLIPSLGAFITPDLLGGAKNLMIGNVIKDQFLAARNWPFGSAIAIILMVIVVLLLKLYLGINKENE
ncbi:MAG: ABC transporter permease [Candidatus Hydrogenedentota bacterium]|nr:MAG: ABC transporter permease [Candidatus Hydrogenedentota bacterium]